MTYEETTAIVKKIHDFYAIQDKFATVEDLITRANYWDVIFKDFTFSVVDKAVSDWMKSHRDMPMPSDLLQKCKDLRDLSHFPSGDPMTWKSTAELNWEARHGVMTEDHEVPKWISDMTDKMVEAMRQDPGIRKHYEETHPTKVNVPDLGDGLPYEI